MLRDKKIEVEEPNFKQRCINAHAHICDRKERSNLIKSMVNIEQFSLEYSSGNASYFNSCIVETACLKS